MVLELVVLDLGQLLSQSPIVLSFFKQGLAQSLNGVVLAQH
jgi:hypothetical protein